MQIHERAVCSECYYYEQCGRSNRCRYFDSVYPESCVRYDVYDKYIDEYYKAWMEYVKDF